MEGNFYYGVIKKTNIFYYCDTCEKCKKNCGECDNYSECFCDTCEHENDYYSVLDLIYTSKDYISSHQEEYYKYSILYSTSSRYDFVYISENAKFDFPNYKEEKELFDVYNELTTEKKRIINSTIKILIKKTNTDGKTSIRTYPFKTHYSEQLDNFYGVLQTVLSINGEILSNEIITWDKSYKKIKQEYDLLMQGKSRKQGHFSLDKLNNYSYVLSYKLLNIAWFNSSYYSLSPEMKKFVTNFRKLYKDEKKLIKDMLLTLKLN